VVGKGVQLGARAAVKAAPVLGMEVGEAAPILTRKLDGANGGAVTSEGVANSVNRARLSMRLSAEQAAGTNAPATITNYSDHAIQQIAGRDGGIGVSQAAVTDAFTNPVNIQYVPSAYGSTFRYTGQNATVVLNPKGNVVTTWGTSSAGVAR
jgi:hypothetical protein